MKEDVKKILLVAGEHSGDLLGGDLLKYLKKEIPNLSFEGIGGDEMLKEGLHSITDIESMNVVGLSGIVSKYKYLKSLARQLVEICKKENIRYAILIDYPGFNLRLTKMLRAEGIEVAFFVSPQIWAWRFKRVFFIRDNISLMLTLFEFEKDIYLKYGVNAEFVGHPLVQRLEDKLKEYPPLNIEKNKRYITLMPGSRTTEIKKHLPILLETAQKIQEHFSSDTFVFLIPGISHKNDAFITASLKKYKEENPNAPEVQYHFDRSPHCISISELVILSSGTATLEVTYFCKPMIIMYKASFFSYIVASNVKQVTHIGMVNILNNDKEVCKEFLQYNATMKKILPEAIQLLSNANYRDQMIQKLKEIKDKLGKGNPSEVAAKAILKWIRGN